MVYAQKGEYIGLRELIAHLDRMAQKDKERAWAYMKVKDSLNEIAQFTVTIETRTNK